MTEPTTTRKILRRSIARQLNMPFARYVGDYSNPTASSTAGLLVDTALTQPTDFWKGGWSYVATLGDVRRIVGFQEELDGFYPERNFSAVPTATDEYEIHHLWNANDIHDAINRAIEAAFPSFFDYGLDETHVVQENTLEYTISDISNIWMPFKVWIEIPGSSITFTASAGAATSVTAPSSVVLTSVDTSWKVSIYGGTGAGQVRAVTSVAGQQINVATWTTNPDSTSKCRIWDAAEQLQDWRPLKAARFDQKEFPAKMYLTKRYPHLYGMRFRIQYVAQPVALTADTSTTMVPSEYIVDMAMSVLYGMKANSSNKNNRQRFSQLEEYHRQKAEQYKASRSFRLPEAWLWQPSDQFGFNAGIDPAVGDPLNWYGR